MLDKDKKGSRKHEKTPLLKANAAKHERGETIVDLDFKEVSIEFA